MIQTSIQRIKLALRKSIADKGQKGRKKDDLLQFNSPLEM